MGPRIRLRLRGDRADERGATLIEFSLIFPLLILLLIGTMEIGLAFKDFLTVSAAAREGSRIGAFVGDESTADCQISQSIATYLGPSLDRLDEIQIYRADPATGNQTTDTNTWKLIGDPTDCVFGWTKVVNWAPTSRNVTYDPLGAPLDIIGVRILLDREWITGFPPFTGAYVVDEHAVIRIEPEAFG